MKRVKSTVWCLLLLPVLGSAQTPNCQTELNGFLLGQYKSALASLGKPFKTGNEHGWAYQAYKLPRDGYIVFEIDPERPEQIAAIQITGKSTEMRPFVGIKLGDTEEQLARTVGKPDQVEWETDENLRLLHYKNRNYTIEIGRSGVYSIRLVGNEGCEQRPENLLAPDGKPLLEELRNALLQRDIEALMQVLAPDIEIYKGGRKIVFSQAARSELEKGNTEFTRLLFAPHDSFRALLADEKPIPDPQLRVYEKASPGHVIKFPTSKILEEIVYKFEAGRWRLWEIKFR